MYDENSSSIVNVLHLTDLHFELSAKRRTARLPAIHALLSVLRRITEEGEYAEEHNARSDDWRPSIVVVTGDIAYGGFPEESARPPPSFKNCAMSSASSPAASSSAPETTTVTSRRPTASPIRRT